MLPTDEEISKCEEMLGVSFSKQCKEFYKRYNNISFIGYEIFGISLKNYKQLEGNSVSYSLSDRQQFGLNKNWIPFYNYGESCMAYFDYSDLNNDGEPKVICAQYNGKDFLKIPGETEDDFGDFLLKLANECESIENQDLWHDINKNKEIFASLKKLELKGKLKMYDRTEFIYWKISNDFIFRINDDYTALLTKIPNKNTFYEIMHWHCYDEEIIKDINDEKKLIFIKDIRFIGKNYKFITKDKYEKNKYKDNWFCKYSVVKLNQGDIIDLPDERYDFDTGVISPEEYQKTLQRKLNIRNVFGISLLIQLICFLITGLVDKINEGLSLLFGIIFFILIPINIIFLFFYLLERLSKENNKLASFLLKSFVIQCISFIGFLYLNDKNEILSVILFIALIALLPINIILFFIMLLKNNKLRRDSKKNSNF